MVRYGPITVTIRNKIRSTYQRVDFAARSVLWSFDETISKKQLYDIISVFKQESSLCFSIDLITSILYWPTTFLDWSQLKAFVKNIVANLRLRFFFYYYYYFFFFFSFRNLKKRNNVYLYSFLSHIRPVSTMFMWENSQWLGKNIVRSVG